MLVSWINSSRYQRKVGGEGRISPEQRCPVCRSHSATPLRGSNLQRKDYEIANLAPLPLGRSCDSQPRTPVDLPPLSKNAPAAFLRARFLGAMLLPTPINDRIAPCRWRSRLFVWTLLGTLGDSNRQDRDNPMAPIDDDDLITHNEVPVSSPFGIDLNNRNPPSCSRQHGAESATAAADHEDAFPGPLQR